MPIPEMCSVGPRISKAQSAAHALLTDGRIVSAARMGTEVQLYSQENPKAAFQKNAGWKGTYAHVSTAKNSPRVAYVYSALDRPMEVYIADGVDKLEQAHAITAFNKLFTERDLPQGKPFQWTSDDGTKVEGMLMYPPGKFEAKNLPMLTFIHGGPADADGNHFEADWYQWDRLAATNGWLVFEPNYRGSTGYGDKFLMRHRSGDCLAPGQGHSHRRRCAGERLASPIPNRLTVGGYSYGGYMTNWLITQTDRFKAAVTGAGAVEHAGNWGNDDMTVDDAYFLGGRPWEAAKRYYDEGAHLPDRQGAYANSSGGRRQRHSRGCLRRLSARSRAALARHSQHAADLPRRRPLPGQESLARKDQSARRVEVAAEVRRGGRHAGVGVCAEWKHAAVRNTAEQAKNPRDWPSVHAH